MREMGSGRWVKGSRGERVRAIEGESCEEETKDEVGVIYSI